jgi:hypothetical protein
MGLEDRGKSQTAHVGLGKIRRMQPYQHSGLRVFSRQVPDLWPQGLLAGIALHVF